MNSPIKHNVYRSTIGKLRSWYCDHTSERFRGWAGLIFTWAIAAGLSAVVTIWLIERG